MVPPLRLRMRMVTVPLSTGGEPGVTGYEELIDTWISRLLQAFAEADRG